MPKSSHFSGLSLYCQVIKMLDKSKILAFSREYGGEHYIKHFNCWSHLAVMLYAVLLRFDSLREITTSLLAETRKLTHFGITFKIDHSTLADANQRRPEAIFETIYRDLYTTYRHALSSDSRNRKTPKWMKQLQTIDSTTITFFSNLLFKGVGHHPKTGKKKGGIKVHTVIHAYEGVPSDIKFTSAATNNSLMLKPSTLSKGDIIAMDRAHIDYEKFEQLTQQGVTYVTKMKKNLKYKVLSDTMCQTPEGLLEVRIQNVEFVKQLKDGETIHHQSCIITYVAVKKTQAVIAADKQYGVRPPGNHRNIPPEMGNQASVQADIAELPAEILLWQGCQRNQVPNLGNTHRKPTADGVAEESETTVELLRAGNNGKNHPDVLCRLPKPVQQP